MKAVRVIGLERLELERLRDRVGQLFAALQEATEEAVYVRVELPGVTAAQIKLSLTNTTLRVSGEKKRRVPRARILSHLCSERSYGAFSRTIPLRWTINVPEATAELKDGVLLVRLPKRKDRRGSEFKVPIKENDELAG